MSSPGRISPRDARSLPGSPRDARNSLGSPTPTNISLQQQITKLKEELETEKRNNKILQREKKNQITTLVKEQDIRQNILIKDLKSKHNSEKHKELEQQKDYLSKKHEGDITKAVKQKDLRINKLLNDIQILRDQLMMTNAADKKGHLTLDQHEKKLFNELQELRASKHQLEETLATIASADKTKASDLRRLHDEHAAEISKIQRESQLETRRLMEEMKSKDRVLGQLEKEMGYQRGHFSRLQLELEEQDQIKKNTTMLSPPKEASQTQVKRLKDVEEKLKSMQEKNKRFLEKNIDLTSKNRTLQDRIKNLSQENTQMRVQYEQTVKKLDQTQDEKSQDICLEELDDLRRQKDELNKTIVALKQAHVEKDRRIELLKHRRQRSKKSMAQKRAAGVKETYFGYEEDTGRSDSETSFSSVLSVTDQSYDTPATDEDVFLDEFSREQFQTNYQRLVKEHLELEKNYSLLMAQQPCSMDPERQQKARTLLEEQGRLRAKLRGYVRQVEQLEGEQENKGHQLADLQEQNEVLEFRCLELEEHNSKLLEEITSCQVYSHPTSLSADGTLTLQSDGALDNQQPQESLKILNVKDKLQKLYSKQDGSTTSEERSVLMQAQLMLDSAAQKLRDFHLSEQSLKTRVADLEREKADLLSAATGVSADIVLEHEHATNALRETQLKVEQLEKDVSDSKQREAVLTYQLDVTQKSENHLLSEIEKLKRQRSSYLEGRDTEADLFNEKMSKIKSSENRIQQLEQLAGELQDKVLSLQWEKSQLQDVTQQTDTDAETRLVRLTAAVEEHEKAQSDLVAQKFHLEEQLSNLQEKVQVYEEREIDLEKMNIGLRDQVKELEESNKAIWKQQVETTHSKPTKEEKSMLEDSNQEGLDGNIWRTKFEEQRLTEMSLQERIADLEQAESILKQSLSSQMEQLETLTAQYEETTRVEKETKEQLKEKELIEQALEEKIKNLELSEKYANEKLSENEATEIKLTAQLAQFNDLKRDLYNIEELKNTIDCLQVENHSMKEKLVQFEDSEHMLKQKMKNVEDIDGSKIEMLQGKTALLEDMNKTLEDQLAEKEQLEVELKTKIAVLTNDIIELETGSGVKDLKNKLKQLEASEQSLKTKVDDLILENNRLEDKVEDVKEEKFMTLGKDQEKFDELQINYMRLSETVTEMEANEQTLLNRLKVYEQSMGDPDALTKGHKVRIDELEVTEQSLVQELDMLEESHDALKLKEQKYRDEIQFWKEKVETLESAKSNPNDTNMVLDNNSTVEELQQEITTLKEKIETLENKEGELLGKLYETHLSQTEEGDEHNTITEPTATEHTADSNVNNSDITPDNNANDSIDGNTYSASKKGLTETYTLPNNSDELKHLKDAYGDLQEQLQSEKVKSEKLEERLNIMLDSESKLFDRITYLEGVEIELGNKVEAQQKPMSDSPSSTTESPNAIPDTASLEKIDILIQSEEKLLERLGQYETVEETLNEKLNQATKQQLDLQEKLREKEISEQFLRDQLRSEAEKGTVDKLTTEVETLKTSEEHLSKQVELYSDKEKEWNEIKLYSTDRISTLEENEKQLNDKITELEALNKVAISERHILNAKIETLEESKESLKASLQEVKSQENSLQDQVIATETLQAEISELRSNLNNLTEEKKAFTEKINHLEKVKDDLNSRLEDQNATETMLRNKINELQSVVSELQESLKQKDSQIASLQDSLKNAKVTIQSENESLTSQINTLHEKNTELTSRLELSETTHEDEIKTLNAKIKEYEDAEHADTSFEVALQEKVADLTKSETELREQVSVLQSAAQQQESANSAETTELLKRVHSLETENSELKQSSPLNSEPGGGLIHPVIQTDSEILYMKSSDELIDTIQTLGKCEKDYQKKISELELEIQGLRNQMKKSNVPSIKIEPVFVIAEGGVYGKSKDELIDDITKLHQNEYVLQQRITTLQEERDSLQKEMHKQMDDIVHKEQELLQLKDQSFDSVSTSEENTSMERENAKLQGQLKQIEALENEHIQKINNLESLINQYNYGVDSSDDSVDGKADLHQLTKEELCMKVRGLEKSVIMQKRKIDGLEQHLVAFRSTVENLAVELGMEMEDIFIEKQPSPTKDRAYADKLQELIQSEASLRQTVLVLETKLARIQPEESRAATSSQNKAYIQDLEHQIESLQQNESRVLNKLRYSGQNEDCETLSKLKSLQERVFELELSEKQLKRQLSVANQHESDLEYSLLNANSEPRRPVRSYLDSSLMYDDRDGEDELRMKIKHHEATIVELSTELEKLRKLDAEGLAVTVEHLQTSNRALERKLELLESYDDDTSVDVLNSPEDILRQRIRDLESMEKHLKTQVSDLEHDREELHEIARKDKNVIHELNVTNRELTLSERNLQEQIKHFEVREDSMLRQIDSLEDKVRDLEELLNQLTDSQRKLKQQVQQGKVQEESLARQVASLEDTLGEMQTAEVAYKKQINALELDKRSTQIKIDNLERSSDDLASNESSLRGQMKVQEKKENQYKQQITELENTSDHSTRRAKQLETLNDQLHEKAHKLEEEKASYKFEVSDLSMRNQELSDKVKNLEDARRLLQTQIDDMKRNEDTLRQKGKELHLKDVTREQRATELEISQTMLQDKIKLLENNEVKLKTRIQELEASLFSSQLSASGSRANADDDALHKQVDETQQRVITLEKQLETVKESLWQYETGHKDQSLAVIPRKQLSEMRAQVSLLEEVEENVCHLEKTEAELRDTVRQLRQGKDVCGHESQLRELKQMDSKYRDMVQEYQQLEASHQQLREQTHQFKQNLQGGDIAVKSCRAKSTQTEATNEVQIGKTDGKTVESTDPITRQKSLKAQLMKDLVKSVPSSGVTTNPPQTAEFVWEKVHGSTNGTEQHHPTPENLSKLPKKLYKPHPQEEKFWKSIESKLPNKLSNLLSHSMWEKVEKLHSRPDLVKDDDLPERVDDDASSIASSVPPPPLPMSMPPPSGGMGLSTRPDDSSYYLPSVQQGAQSADEASDLEMDSPPRDYRESVKQHIVTGTSKDRSPVRRPWSRRHTPDGDSVHDEITNNLSVKEKLTQVERQLKVKDKEVEQLRTTQMVLERKLKASGDNTTLNAQLQELQHDNERLASTVQQLQKKCKKLENDLIEKQEELSKMRLESDIGSYSSMRTTNDKPYGNDISQVFNDLAQEKKADKKAVDDHIGFYKNLLEKKERELIAKGNECKNLNTELRESLEKSRQSDSVLKQYNDLQTKYQALQDSHNALQQRYNDLEREHAKCSAWRDEKEKLSRDVSNLRKDIKDMDNLESERKDIEERLTRAEKILKEKQTELDKMKAAERERQMKPASQPLDILTHQQQESFDSSSISISPDSRRSSKPSARHSRPSARHNARSESAESSISETQTDTEEHTQRARHDTISQISSAPSSLLNNRKPGHHGTRPRHTDRHNPRKADVNVSSTGGAFIAIADYKPDLYAHSHHPRLELPLKEGQKVTVLGPVDSQGFYEAEVEGSVGLVPANYILADNSTPTVPVRANRERHLVPPPGTSSLCPEEVLNMQAQMQRLTTPFTTSERRFTSNTQDRQFATPLNGSVRQPVPSHTSNTPGTPHVGSIPQTSHQQATSAPPAGRSRPATQRPPQSHMTPSQLANGRVNGLPENNNNNNRAKYKSAPSGQLSNGVQGQPMSPSRFQIQRILPDRSLLLSWQCPLLDCLTQNNGTVVTGYNIYMDGQLKQRVTNPHLSRALLEKQDLTRPHTLAIQTTAEAGVSQMVYTLFEDVLPEPSITSSRHSDRQDSDISSISSHNETRENRVFVAVYDYEPSVHSPNQNPNAELRISTGDIIRTNGPIRSDGFYHGEANGVRGLVPASFMEEVATSRKHQARVNQQQASNGTHRPHTSLKHKPKTKNKSQKSINITAQV
ncbi:unnamed protein product [Owenia fusiformis]|uniref:SH3 domain-containing protein n=1 Tax=Owenia fusiformis TaxID=6347 RepID=A0A8S4NMK0_OWEFU|nr:unnamed protein product [Owenia fusiformis]